MTGFKNSADARNDDLRHQEIEEAKRDREPEQLRCEMGRIKGREHAGASLAFVGHTRFGVHLTGRSGIVCFGAFSGG
ncbi:hypothetical protein D3C86_1920560 [compost metagenome]